MVFDTQLALVSLTAIYVIATIMICWFNYKTSKTTRDQTEEMKKQISSANEQTEEMRNQLKASLAHTVELRKQFEETNCPIISVYADLQVKETLPVIVIVIQNVGCRDAINFSINLVSELSEVRAVSEAFKSSKMTLGVGQKFMVKLCNQENIDASTPPVKCNYSYEFRDTQFQGNVVLQIAPMCIAFTPFKTESELMRAGKKIIEGVGILMGPEVAGDVPKTLAKIISSLFPNSGMEPEDEVKKPEKK